ncbi:hypothetical protein ACLB2K_020254 [Fragaria x ananassa]
MDGGTSRVRGWMTGPAESANGWRESANGWRGSANGYQVGAKSEGILFASSRGPKPGRGAKSEGMSREGGCRDWGRETKSAFPLRLREAGCPDQFLGAAFRRVGLGRRLGWPCWIHWKTVCLMAVKAKLVYLELVSDVGLFALLWSVSPFGGVLPLE